MLLKIISFIHKRSMADCKCAYACNRLSAVFVNPLYHFVLLNWSCPMKAPIWRYSCVIIKLRTSGASERSRKHTHCIFLLGLLYHRDAFDNGRECVQKYILHNFAPWYKKIFVKLMSLERRSAMLFLKLFIVV